jgi:hypothetical protein
MITTQIIARCDDCGNERLISDTKELPSGWSYAFVGGLDILCPQCKLNTYICRRVIKVSPLGISRSGLGAFHKVICGNTVKAKSLHDDWRTDPDGGLICPKCQAEDVAGEELEKAKIDYRAIFDKAMDEAAHLVAIAGTKQYDQKPIKMRTSKDHITIDISEGMRAEVSGSENNSKLNIKFFPL